jgi:ribitol 2-dehydrogenase
MQSLRGKGVLVTGASSGIGRACAKAFAQEGMRLAISARSVDKLDALARELGGDVVIIRQISRSPPTSTGWSKRRSKD